MAKGEKDLVEQAKHNKSQAQQRARALPLMEPGFMGMPAKVNAKVRTQPGDAQQINAAQANMQNGSPSAMPTPYAKGGKVAKHDDAAADTKLFNKLYDKKEKAEPKELAKGGKMNWIAGAVKKPGALHRELGVPEGKKIPKSKIDAAANSSNPTLAKRANFAKTVSKFADGGSMEKEESPKFPRNKMQKFAVGGVAKIRHDQMTDKQKQKPAKPSGSSAYK